MRVDRIAKMAAEEVQDHGNIITCEHARNEVEEAATRIADIRVCMAVRKLPATGQAVTTKTLKRAASLA